MKREYFTPSEHREYCVHKLFTHRRRIMSRLFKTQLARLHLVAKRPTKAGVYRLAFSHGLCNQLVEAHDIIWEFCELIGRLFRSGTYYSVTNDCKVDSYYDNRLLLKTYDGKTLSISDIRSHIDKGQLDDDSNGVEFYVLINQTCSEIRWAVAEKFERLVDDTLELNVF